MAVAGGNGSINEVLPVILHTEVALVILPLGSGNGLARHLHYHPMNVKKVLQNLDNAIIDRVDVGQSGQVYFSSNAGAGFDGFIARSFMRQRTRGFWGYAVSVIRYMFFYKPFRYKLKTEGTKVKGEAFMITFFNSNQYGFNVKMAQGASVKDGLLEVYIVNKFPSWMPPFYAVAVLFGWHERCKRITHYTAERFTLKMKKAVDFHIDGEGIGKINSVQIESIPSSLKVLIPHR